MEEFKGTELIAKFKELEPFADNYIASYLALMLDANEDDFRTAKLVILNHMNETIKENKLLKY